MIAEMTSAIDSIVAELPEPPAEPLTYYHELDPDCSRRRRTRSSGVSYGLLGLDNVADAAADETDYPQLNAEFLITADPDLVFPLQHTAAIGAWSPTLRPPGIARPARSAS